MGGLGVSSNHTGDNSENSPEQMVHPDETTSSSIPDTSLHGNPTAPSKTIPVEPKMSHVMEFGTEHGEGESQGFTRRIQQPYQESYCLFGFLSNCDLR